jgi:hypothetical protein
LAGCRLLVRLLQECCCCCWGWVIWESRGNNSASLSTQTLRKLKRTWDSASLRTETLKVMVMQFLDQLLVFVCKSEDRDCKRGHGTVPIWGQRL